jgi:hypothetical protein
MSTNTKPQFQLSEGARNAGIVFVMLVIVVLISYFEWRYRS